MTHFVRVEAVMAFSFVKRNNIKHQVKFFHLFCLLYLLDSTFFLFKLYLQIVNCIWFCLLLNLTSVNPLQCENKIRKTNYFKNGMFPFWNFNLMVKLPDKVMEKLSLIVMLP